MAIDPQLAAMVSGQPDVPEIYPPSPFWEQLAAAGIPQPAAGGIQQFKPPLPPKTFNWQLPVSPPHPTPLPTRRPSDRPAVPRPRGAGA